MIIENIRTYIELIILDYYLSFVNNVHIYIFFQSKYTSIQFLVYLVYIFALTLVL
jgi:hypothetical protein